ncbi:unnamed protein product [Ostreobium quekettii]|uniref:Uncharacterized protein n=1 Tax=Ostreobium quekettii TaxID=121088 RepID=A0A8S1IYQ4_9CHLO|nr:unnamed protein product [Ostreobium quekettii]
MEHGAAPESRYGWTRVEPRQCAKTLPHTCPLAPQLLKDRYLRSWWLAFVGRYPTGQSSEELSIPTLVPKSDIAGCCRRELVHRTGRQTRLSAHGSEDNELRDTNGGDRRQMVDGNQQRPLVVDTS